MICRWHSFLKQWRNSYLLLLVMFWMVWRAAAATIPQLENARFMGGLHPIDVFWLMNLLKLMWLPPLIFFVLYTLSFWVELLNTPTAIAVSALSSSAILVLLLFAALLRNNFL